MYRVTKTKWNFFKKPILRLVLEDLISTGYIFQLASRLVIVFW